MRVLIIADIHANLAALQALPPADAIICAGDVVGFGPQPGAVIDKLIRLGAYCVRGDEDDAVAKGIAHPTPPSLSRVAEEMREHTYRALSGHHTRWLRALPPELELTFDCIRIGVTHACPGDYSRYIKPTDEEASRVTRAFPHCEIVVLGHTHRPGKWKGKNLIVNPGSVGMPHRPGYACYAMLENRRVTFSEATYDPTATLEALLQLDISNEAYLEYAHELTIGSVRPVSRLAHVG